MYFGLLPTQATNPYTDPLNKLLLTFTENLSLHNYLTSLSLRRSGLMIQRIIGLLCHLNLLIKCQQLNTRYAASAPAKHRFTTFKQKTHARWCKSKPSGKVLMLIILSFLKYTHMLIWIFYVVTPIKSIVHYYSRTHICSVYRWFHQTSWL